MLSTAAGNFSAARAADSAIAASRQIWLAGLGLGVVTRQWAANDAGEVFRSLVKEGVAVEGRARRVIGKRIDNSLALAASAWNSARHNALTTVNGFVDAATAALPRLRAPVVAKAAPAKAKRRSPAKTRKARVATRSRAK